MRKVNKQQAFQMIIEERVKQGVSYMDAMTEYMEEHTLEATQVAKLISPGLQEKIRKEAISYNLISGKNESESVLDV